MKNKGKIAAGAAAAAIAIGAAFAGHNIDQPTPAPTCPVTDVRCAAEQSAPQDTTQPRSLQALTVQGAFSNGRLPASALLPATGCTSGLAKGGAAESWNAMAVAWHNRTGQWPASNGSASCYRTYQQQVDLRNYWCNLGNCGNAAVPGTSNHGWGTAVDSNSVAQQMVLTIGPQFHWNIRGGCSDAPWEDWHAHYCGGYNGPNPGPYGSGGGSGHQFHTLHHGDKGPRVGKLTTHLALLDNLHDKAPHYLAWDKRSKVYTTSVKHAVSRLQHDGHLATDGVYGPKTAAYQANRWHYYCKHHDTKVCR